MSGYYMISGVERVCGKPIDMRKFSRTGAWKREIARKQKEIAGKLRQAAGSIDCCPICKNKLCELFVNIYDYPYLLCSDCRHIFNSAPPDEASVSLMYSGSESGTQALQGEIYMLPDQFKDRVNNIALPKAEFIDRRIKEKGLWVDVGAGVGDLVISAKKLGWNVVGMESDSREADFARKMRADVRNVCLNKENAKEYIGPAKVVSIINILEHIIDPVAFLRLISENLDSGSALAVEVPRHPSLSTLSNVTFPELAARHIYAPDHLHIFSEKSMEIMLRSCGLSPQSIWLFGQDIHELFSSCASLGRLDDHSVLRDAYSIVAPLQKVVDENGFSDSMFVLARKDSLT